MKGRSRLSVAFIFVAGLAVAAFLLQATPLLFGAISQSASSGTQGHDAALAKLLKGSGTGSQLTKEEVRRAVQEALDSELRASGTDTSRREALLALLAEADAAAAASAAPSPPPTHQSAHSPPPFQPPPPPPPLPQQQPVPEGAIKKVVGFHGYGANRATQHGRATKKPQQQKPQKPQQQKGIAAWVKGRAEKQVRADRELAVRKQPGREQVSSGFPDMAPIAQAQCNIPFDISGAPRGGSAAGGNAPPGGQGPPPLTVDMVRRAAQNGVAIMSFTNAKTLHMTLNWALHLRLAGISPGPLVGLMPDVDEEGYARCAAHMIPFAAGSTSASGIGHQDEMGAQGGRWALARAAMQVVVDAGVSLLLSDNDVIWLRNPIPYLNAIHKRHPNIDFIISSDAPTSHAKMPFKKDNNYVKVDGAMELGLEDCLVNHAPFNIGIIWFAAHQKSVELLQRFVTTVEKIQEVDQWPINLMLREGMMESIFKIRDKYGESGDRAAYPVDNGSFNMGVFNTPQFASALVYSVTQAWRNEGLKPYAIHLTYVQNQHLQSKILRAREELFFADPPSYYTEDKILTFTIDIPPEMLETPVTERGALPEHHFALLELQLRHVQAALMVGRALGRTVVLPRFSCTCQNEGIVPHENCRGPGHPTKLPYKCPSDHVFVPYEIYKLKVKPPGFTDHPCMPPEFMSNSLRVEVCTAKPGASCPEGGIAGGFATLRATSTDREVYEQLSQYKDVNVLIFTDIAKAYGGFETDDSLKSNTGHNHGGGFLNIVNRSLYKFFSYEPPPNGVPYDPLGPVHENFFQWPFPWLAKDMQQHGGDA